MTSIASLGCTEAAGVGRSLGANGARLASGQVAIAGQAWPSATISICWTEDGEAMSSAAAASYAADLDWIEALVHATWEGTFGVRFAFSRDCAGGFDAGLDVHGDQAITYGRALHDQPPVGVELRDLGESSTERWERLRAEALLASGRILGLEWTAAEGAAGCASPFTRGCEQPDRLAPATVRLAVVLYGPAPGVLITPGGQCMYSRSQRGAYRPLIDDCGPAADVRHALSGPWLFPTNYSLFDAAGGLLRDDGGGTPWFNWGGAGGSFSFRHRHVQHRGIGDRCITAPREGEPFVTMRTCDGGADQQYDGYPFVRDGLCFEPLPLVIDGVRYPERPGAPIIQTPCRQGPAPRDPLAAYAASTWTFEDGGTIRNGWSRYCLTQVDDPAAEGEWLRSEPCTGALTQAFTTHALIENLDDWSLDLPEGEVAEPTLASEGPTFSVSEALGLDTSHRRWLFRPGS